MADRPFIARASPSGRGGPAPATEAAAAGLTIRLKRYPDGSASLTCTRADGTVTWQRQRGPLGTVFPPHDLTHFAIESTLGYRRAFYGLVAEGWNIADFAPPWPRGTVPAEAREVEMLVGLFDGMRAEVDPPTPAELNARLQTLAADSKFAATVHPRTFTAEQIERVRKARQELLERWRALAPGNAIELRFG